MGKRNRNGSDDTTASAVSRRQALARLGSGAVAALPLGAWVTGCGGGSYAVYRVDRPGPDGLVALPESTVASLRRASDVVLVDIAEVGRLALRLIDGRLRAITTRCTHAGCAVDPGPRGYECPCHGSAYDLHGKVTNGPANEALAAYPVRRLRGKVVIATARRGKS